MVTEMGQPGGKPREHKASGPTAEQRHRASRLPSTARSCPKRVYNDIDSTLAWTMLKWARHRHEAKTDRSIMDRYFGPFHPSRQDRWIFGDRETGAYLRKLSWTPIRRHQMVNAYASPDDPALTYYWQQRRRRHLPRDTPAPAPRSPRRSTGLA